MRLSPRRTASLGEVIAAAFDQASLYSTDLREVSRLATEAVAGLLRRGERRSPRPVLLLRRLRTAR
jgi:hypothetical protein